MIGTSSFSTSHGGCSGGVRHRRGAADASTGTVNTPPPLVFRACLCPPLNEVWCAVRCRTVLCASVRWVLWRVLCCVVSHGAERCCEVLCGAALPPDSQGRRRSGGASQKKSKWGARRAITFRYSDLKEAKGAQIYGLWPYCLRRVRCGVGAQCLRTQENKKRGSI